MFLMDTHAKIFTHKKMHFLLFQIILKQIFFSHPCLILGKAMVLLRGMYATNSTLRNTFVMVAFKKARGSYINNCALLRPPVNCKL